MLDNRNKRAFCSSLGTSFNRSEGLGASFLNNETKKENAMARLLKILVTGDKDFNNYFMAHPYLKELIAPGSVILTCGNTGTDTIAEIYAGSNQHICDVFHPEFDNYGKSAVLVRNRGVVKMCNYAIIFWDGRNKDTESVIEMAKRKFSKPTVIRYGDEDIIRPHPGRVVNVRDSKPDVYCGRGSVFGNPFVMSKDYGRQVVVLQYMDYLIKNARLMEAMLDLKKDAVLGCHCSPKLCHCDAILWILDNARDDLKLILSRLTKKNQFGNVDAKKPPGGRPKPYPKPEDFDPSSRLYSKHGILLSEGFSEIVEDGRFLMVEMPNKMVVKENLHLPKKTLDYLKENNDDVVSVRHHTNETDNIVVTYYNVAFANTPYKEGYWYVDLRDVMHKR